MGKKTKKRQQEFLLTFFSDEPKYQEKEINGFILVKCFNGNNKRWQVAIYTQDSFRNYKEQGKLL